MEFFFFFCYYLITGNLLYYLIKILKKFIYKIINLLIILNIKKNYFILFFNISNKLDKL